MVFKPFGVEQDTLNFEFSLQCGIGMQVRLTLSTLKIGCLVMRIKQKIIHNTLSKMKNQIVPTYMYVQGNHEDSLGEISNMSQDMFGAERSKDITHLQICNQGRC